MRWFLALLVFAGVGCSSSPETLCERSCDIGCGSPENCVDDCEANALSSCDDKFEAVLDCIDVNGCNFQDCETEQTAFNDCLIEG